MPAASMTSPPVSRLFDLRASGGPALPDDACARSFTEVADRAAAIASVLAARYGLAKGQRAAILASPGAAWFETFLAVVMAGGIAVPLSPAYPPPELAWLADDSGASI